jgi:hypothetical protein
MPVRGGLIVAVIDPEHRDTRLGLYRQMENDGFIGPKIRRDDGPAPALGDGPARNLERRTASQLLVPLRDLIGGHDKTSSKTGVPTL